MALIAVVLAITGCNATCQERVAMKACRQANPSACIWRASIHYRLTRWQHEWMKRVPWCESKRNPYARNPSGSSGFYQFLPSTWATTPYAKHSIWYVKWQTLAAAWMLKVGRAPGEWACK